MTTRRTPWIAEKIARRQRAAQPATCGECGTPVLVGDDADMCACTVIVDATPTTPAGELDAHMAGRQTYALISGDLCERTNVHMRLHHPRQPLHIEHRCGDPR